MEGTKRSVRWVMGLGLVLIVAAPVWAEENTPMPQPGPSRKLGRGVANIVTCPLELIRTPELVGRKHGTLAALSVGIVEGAVRTVGRGVAGIAEVVTFFAPWPKQYEPLIQPEFVWARGNWEE